MSLKLYQKANIIVTEMISDRGYTNISQEENLILTDQVLILFSKDQSVNINTIKNFIVLLNDHSKTHGILVYPESITSSAKKAINLIDKDIELFQLSELQYNIIKHSLVPNHTKLDNLNELGKTNKLHLPIILSTDVVSRYYRFKKGDVIRIVRRDGIISYRRVK